MRSLLCYCRSGYEKDLAAELTAIAQHDEIHGHVQASAGQGWVLWHSDQPQSITFWLRHFPLDRLMFARQTLFAQAPIATPNPTHRLTPVFEALTGWPMLVCDVQLEVPDTETMKPMLGFCRRAQPKMSAFLRENHILQGDVNLPTLVLCWLDPQTVVPALNYAESSSPWPMGIARLRFPSAAPSRSILKLVEAIHIFLSPEEQEHYLRLGATAVDLGAAPGGWTYQFVQYQMHVTAVDNGPISPAIMKTGLVEHRREDAFRYRPKHAVEWLVCDMLERPSRVIELVATWFKNRWCQRAIINLKLPMKKRYDAIQACLDSFMASLESTDIRVDIRHRHLYHDRDEVTLYIGIPAPSPSRRRSSPNHKKRSKRT